MSWTRKKGWSGSKILVVRLPDEAWAKIAKKKKEFKTVSAWARQALLKALDGV